MIKCHTIYLPGFLNLLVAKKKLGDEKTTYVYAYSLNIYVKLGIPGKYVFIDRATNVIKVYFDDCPILMAFINRRIEKFLQELHCHYGAKIKFKGKGYKVKIFKKRKIIQFFFGVSHIKIVRLKKIILKKLTKYKFFLKSNDWRALKKISDKIVNIRKINPYTLRGLRLSKMVIVKRKGKKGVWI